MRKTNVTNQGFPCNVKKRIKMFFLVAENENSFTFATAISRKAYSFHADMVELVDMLDLGSSAVRRVGSTPSIRTKAYSKE